jgi:phage terminase large subunit-like protein
MKFTEKQNAAQAIMAGDAKHCMLFGGSRSGKTVLHVRNVVFRGLKAPGSRHGIFRFRALHVHESIVLDTFPKVMKLAFPRVGYEMHKGDGYATIYKDEDGESEVWFSGLDDKERVEKVLGKEFATLYFNECSQIPMSSVDVALTRLAQLVNVKMWDAKKKEFFDKGPLKPRAFYDCNPPSKAHWSYKRFILKVDPESGRPLNNPGDYASFQINPADNTENLSPSYLETLKGMSPRLQKRFLKGEFADATPNRLFAEEVIDRWRTSEIPCDLVRVVVGVDPSGSGDVDNADNDAIGIVVGGLGTDGNAYLLEDCTVKAGPATWGRMAVSAWQRHDGDAIVGETNYGGEMVLHTVRTAAAAASVRPTIKKVTASRGKVQRAEPFSALYEQGKVRHAGEFRELEDEMIAFSTYGYLGDKSPNRADAWFWVLAELFPGMVRGEKKAEQQPEQQIIMPSATGWMA